MNEILDVDLLAFESGSSAERAAVVDGVMRSLATGFVYTRHDVSESLLDDAYDILGLFSLSVYFLRVALRDQGSLRGRRVDGPGRVHGSSRRDGSRL